MGGDKSSENEVRRKRRLKREGKRMVERPVTQWQLLAPPPLAL
jgi:hypothetical protein